MNDQIRCTDIVVIGGGIGGASVAAQLAQDASVILIEAEEQPGYHATGRSAAYFASVYGNRDVRAVTAASRPFFFDPPDDFTDVPLLKRRSGMYFARRDQIRSLALQADELGAGATLIEANAVTSAVPVMRPEYVAAGLYFDDGGDIDVNALLYGYLRRLKGLGSSLAAGTEVRSIQRKQGVWLIDTNTGLFSAPIVVNAAGAWADQTAKMAGLGCLNLEPRRRTACLIEAPRDLDISDWPIMVDIDEQLYFKPDAGAIMISPADESPSPACDAQPEDIDVAIAVDRFEKATTMDVQRVRYKWAGLRTFAVDESPVVGFDPRAKGFFWLAGQGGYGVQTAPGLAHLSAYIVAGQSLTGEYQGLAKFIEKFEPARLI